jgi:hypothetical protein
MAIHPLARASLLRRLGQRWRQSVLLSTMAITLVGSGQLLGTSAKAAAIDTPGGKGAQVSLLHARSRQQP